MLLIENASGEPPAPGRGVEIRRTIGVGAKVPVVLYTGTFEAYQGLDLLYGAMRLVIADRPGVKLVMVGGEPAQVAAARAQVRDLGLGDAVIFTGQRAATDIPMYLDAADVLVSPRSTGTNTPLKIYQYLRSGKPIVATRLRTHTQVLDDATAFLAEPTPDAFATAVLAALDQRDRAQVVASRARALADTKYSEEAFLAKTRQACEMLVGDARAEVAGGLA
jgi:glycosyltransferase involved in cell wall biosynthesis